MRGPLQQRDTQEILKAPDLLVQGGLRDEEPPHGPTEVQGWRHRNRFSVRLGAFTPHRSHRAAPPATVPSLRAVARECGVSATAVYRHFSSQSDLIRSVLLARFADFESTILCADDLSAASEDRVRMIAHAYLAWGVENPGIYGLLFESADQIGEGYVVGDASSVLMGRFTEMMTASLPTGASPRDAAERFWTHLHGLVSLRIHKPDHRWLHDGNEEVESLVEMFFAPRA